MTKFQADIPHCSERRQARRIVTAYHRVPWCLPTQAATKQKGPPGNPSLVVSMGKPGTHSSLKTHHCSFLCDLILRAHLKLERIYSHSTDQLPLLGASRALVLLAG